MLTRSLLSATALALIASLVPAGAQEAQPSGAQLAGHRSATLSLPEGADEAAWGQHIALPDMPAIPADLGLATEATGSVAAVTTTGLGAAEPFDAPGGPAPAPADPAPAVPAAVVPPPAAPVAATPAEPPPATAAAPSLDAGALAQALAGFVAATPAGATTAATNERRAQREAVAAFYAARGNVPVWVADGRLAPAARAAMARLDHAAEDGLDVSRYALAVPRDGQPATLAGAELALSEAVVAYARQASGSRVDPGRIGGIVDLRPVLPDAAQVLGAVPLAADAGEALRAYNPPQPGYAALRAKLAELRQESGSELISRIPPGPVLKPGMTDARVPLIRARFGLDVASVEPGVPPLVYDTKVAAAVAAFQKAHGLPASGLLTQRTIAALSGGNPVLLEHEIVANMELWRWMPRSVEPDRIEVNIPDFTARVVRGDAPVHQTRVVVGQPDKPTPVFTQTMKFIIVNPYWNVPLSIIKKEMMPKLAGDPNYFANHGYEVVDRDGTTYVRQPPGDGNALGRIKFMFPNSHSVYLHDTNARSYFGRTMRALSHGCVRVDQPFSFAEAVMGPGSGWSEARIRKLIGSGERTINLPRPLPITIGYFTAFVDPAAGFQLREDVYGYTGKVKAALGLSG